MKRVSSFVRKAVPVAVEAFSRRSILGRFMRQALRAQPAFLVRGSSRRIMSMRFRPANIRVINRRADRLGRHSRGFPLAREKQPTEPPRMYLTGSAISERQVEGHLEEAGASDGVLDYAEFAGRRADIGVGRRAVGLAVDGEWRGVLRRIFEERIELDVVVRRVEARVIEDVERLDVEFQVEAFVDLEVLEDAHVDA